jgi:hypothetical protein
MRRREFIAGFVSEVILLSARIDLEYDVDAIEGAGSIYLPSVQFNDASSDIYRKSAVSNEVHSKQRFIGATVRHIDSGSPNINSERWVRKT